MQLEYYLALLQLHIAVIGVVIAGVVALVQLLNNAKPHRTIRLLVRSRVLVSFGALLTGLLLVLALGSWTSAFPAQAQVSFGEWIVPFYSDGRTGLVIIILSLGSLVWFAQLCVLGRTLLDSHTYLKSYISQIPTDGIRQYLRAIYPDTAIDTHNHNYDGSSDPLSSQQTSVKKPANTRSSAATTIPFDPFQPVREYIKDNAYQYYDYGTADGLKLFSKLFDKTFDSIDRQTGQDDYFRLAQYISESAGEFFMIFSKTNSEKRKMDTIELLYSKGQMLLQAGNDPSLLPVVRSLENIAKHSDDDDEIIAAIENIRRLSDAFLDKHQQHEWDHVAGPFDEICLSVTRISETYYLQKNNSLKTVPIIGYTTGAHRTVTAALVDFFCTYRDLGDRYTDTKPVLYFEAIEGVIEVLFMRLADITATKQQNSGFNMKYYDLAHDLYTIYYSFGIDAIEHSKPELLALSLSNLRRVIKPAKNYKLAAERAELCTMIVSLATKGIATFGDIVIKDQRTISIYTLETLAKHATQAQIDTALVSAGSFSAARDGTAANDDTAATEPVESSPAHARAVKKFMSSLRHLLKD